MLEYPEATLGCPTSTYSLGRSDAVNVARLLRGRQRFNLEDAHPVYIANVRFDFDAAQMSGWQSFWQSINFGVDWFMLAIPDVTPSDGSGLKECHATAPFIASVSDDGRWVVNLNVEFIE